MADNKVEDTVKTVAEVVSGVLEKAPIYEDAAQPALREIGQGLGGMLKMVVLPFKMLGYKSDKLLEEFQKRLEEKGNTIPDDKLQAPDPILAGPIINSLGYTLHKEELREMFTNLLVAGMNSSRSSETHPAFVEIIKQLSTDEAKILNLLAHNLPISIYWSGEKVERLWLRDGINYRPVIKILKIEDFSKRRTIKRNACLLSQESNCEYPEEEAKYIDNLARLGLLEVEYGAKVVYDNAYTSLEVWSGQFTSGEKENFEIEYGILGLTDFGRKFITSCVIDIDSLTRGEYGEWVRASTD